MSHSIEIDTAAFSENLSLIKKKVGKNTLVMPVLKADGYGHGMLPLARKSIAEGIKFIGIGTPEDGIIAREGGINTPILALDGVTECFEKEIVSFNISSIISNRYALDRLEAEAKKLNSQAKVHLKIDTGMGRLGLKPDNFLSFFDYARDKKNIIIEGVMTHFASASQKNDPYTKNQINIFNSCVKKISEKGYTLPLIHAANSGGILYYPESYYNMVRPGIVLYGAKPDHINSEPFEFLPVMQVKSKVIHIHNIKKGEAISYGQTFIAESDMTTAIIPTGYAHGFNRLLSGKAEALIAGKKVRQVGTICMNLSALDITDHPEITIGNEVVLVGKQKDQEITIDEVAAKMGTISYELLCGFGKGRQRAYK